MADVAEAPAAVGSALTKKAGPFPRWVWIVGGLGAAAGVYFFLLKPSSSGSSGGTPINSTPPTGGGAGSSGGTGSDGTTTDTTTDAVVSNADWLATATDSVSQALGMPAAQVRTYLVEYLNGRSPYGNNNALSYFNQAIQSALQLGGKPPNGVQVGDVNSNPYSDIGSYVGSLLSWIPQGTSGAARQEIIDLYNGRITDISQEAQNAIDSATSVIGLGPRQLSYTVGGAARAASDAAKAAADKAAAEAAAATQAAADKAAATKAAADKAAADAAASTKAAADKAIADAKAAKDNAAAAALAAKRAISDAQSNVTASRSMIDQLTAQLTQAQNELIAVRANGLTPVGASEAKVNALQNSLNGAQRAYTNAQATLTSLTGQFKLGG